VAVVAIFVAMLHDNFPHLEVEEDIYFLHHPPYIPLSFRPGHKLASVFFDFLGWLYQVPSIHLESLPLRPPFVAVFFFYSYKLS